MQKLGLNRRGVNQLTAAATPGLLVQKVIGVGVLNGFGWYFLRRLGQFESEVRQWSPMWLPE